MPKLNRFKTKLFILHIFVITLILLLGCQEIEKNLATAKAKNCLGQDEKFSLVFLKTNNQGDKDENGINHVIIFNPKSEELDFKVNQDLRIDK